MLLRLAAASLIIAALGAASARARPVKVRQVMSLKQKTTSPTFNAPSSVQLMNRGAMLFLGSGMWAEQETLYLLRLSDLGRSRVQIPFDAFVRERPGIKLAPKDRRPIHKQFMIDRLLFYDEENGEAGIEVTDRWGNDRVRRHFFMHWDLKKQKITEATLVARSRPGKAHSDSLALGYNHARREFYYARQIYRDKGKPRTVSVIGFRAGKPRVVAQFASARPMRRETYYDQRHNRALLVEYAELADADHAPRGYLVDLGRGKVRPLNIPLTTYGVAFEPSGKRIQVYSSQLGEIWSIEAATGKRLQRLKIGKQGHYLGLLTPTTLLLVRNSGMRFLRLGRRVRRGRFLPMSRVYRGFSHVDGSVVIPGGALIKNGQKLYLLSITGK